MLADMGEEIAHETAVAITQGFEPAERWLERVARASEDLDPASELALDDAATDSCRLSHLALISLAAAVDHFHAARTLIETGRIFHANAQFTLLRAALENAATAVYILVSDDRDTRILRALKVAWYDVTDQCSLWGTMRKQAQRRGARPVADPEPFKSAWKASLEKVAKDLGMSSADVGSVAKGLTYTVIVRDAANDAFGQEQGDLVLLCWKVNSAAAHGKRWDALNKVVSQGVAMPDQLGISVALTKKMIEKAWALFDARRKA